MCKRLSARRRRAAQPLAAEEKWDGDGGIGPSSQRKKLEKQSEEDEGKGGKRLRTSPPRVLELFKERGDRGPGGINCAAISAVTVAA